MVEVNIDGASRGNPGLSAIGIVVKSGENILKEYGKVIGIKTNNQAEYEALKKALEICEGLDNEINILSDSELLINQRNLKYKVRNQELKMITREISNLEKKFDKITYRHIPRKKNSKADHLANLALNSLLKSNGQNNRNDVNTSKQG